MTPRREEIWEWRGQKKGYPVDAGTLGVAIRWQVLGLLGRPHGVVRICGRSAGTRRASSTVAGLSRSNLRVRSSWDRLRKQAVAASTAGAEVRPLVGCENAANAEEHFGVCLFEVGAGVCDLVDLGHGLCGVGRIGAEHGFKKNLLLLDVGFEVDELKAALLKDIVHLPGLLRRQCEPLDDHGVLPPHSRGGDMERAAHAAREAVPITHHVGATAVAWTVVLHHVGAHGHSLVGHALAHVGEASTHGRVGWRLAFDRCCRGR